MRLARMPYEEMTGRQETAAVLLGMFAILVLGVLDYVTGDLTSLVLLYLAPVAFLAWTLGEWWGVGGAVLSALVSSGSDLLLGVSTSQGAITLYWNSVTRLGTFVVVALAVAALRSAVLRERRTSRRDYLTGLLNARGFTEAAEAELDRTRRFGRPLTLLFIDCDDFKAINDRYGHQMGDEVLRSIAGVLADCVRKVDLVARLGGDEFVVLLAEADAPDAMTVVSRIRDGMREIRLPIPKRVDVSVGAATFEEPPASVDYMIGEADRLLYEAKGSAEKRVAQEVVPV